jgi:hypothetical protein
MTSNPRPTLGGIDRNITVPFRLVSRELVLRPMLCLHHASHLQLYLPLGRYQCSVSAIRLVILHLSVLVSARCSVLPAFCTTLRNLPRPNLFHPSASHLQCPSRPPHPHLRLSVPLIPKANHLLIHISIVLQSDPYSLFRSFFSFLVDQS